MLSFLKLKPSLEYASTSDEDTPGHDYALYRVALNK